VEHWLETTVLPAAIAAALLLLVLWPTEHSGKRLLQTWGIPRPQPEQIRDAVRYLRQRRFLYVALFLLLPSLFGGLPGIGIFVPLLVAMLVAEAIATLRPVSGVRTASLDRRSWRDLVPRWAVRTMAVTAVLTTGLALVASAWLALGYVLGCLVLVGGLVALAVRRPSVSDETVDAALRTRTARVAVGIGFGWLATAFNEANQRLQFLAFGGPAPSRPVWLADAMGPATFVVVALAIVCWLWVAVPSRRSLAVR
jgi:hypothetical protein